MSAISARCGAPSACVLYNGGRWQLKETYLSPQSERSPTRQVRSRTPRAAGFDAKAATALILASLDEDKAEDIVSIDIAGKSSVADAIVVASGRSQRHVAALADHIMEKVKEAGGAVRAEGLAGGDWVLLDAGDVIVHLFRPEVRAFYNIEKIWTPAPAKPSAA